MCFLFFFIVSGLCSSQQRTPLYIISILFPPESIIFLERFFVLGRVLYEIVPAFSDVVVHAIRGVK